MSNLAAQWMGTAGVALLLGGFFLNLTGKLGRQSRIYQGLNAVGGALACWASYLIGFLPFVVLEATWTLVAVAAFFSRRPGSPE